MKVLSVKNPWAYLIIFGFDFGPEIGGFKLKDIENRTWETKYRGPLLIHVSKNFDKNAWDNDPFNVKWADYNGCIIGQVSLVDCIRNSTSRWAEQGLWHWVLEDPRPCQPIPAKGSLGLWEYTGKIKPLKQEQEGTDIKIQKQFDFEESEYANGK
jgi:hypothetical protein